MLVAAAGPASNLVLAVVAAVALSRLSPDSAPPRGLNLADVDVPCWLAVINVLLAVFNMLPIPPLDGGNVLAGLLPPRGADVLDRLRPFGFLILYALMLHRHSRRHRFSPPTAIL